MDRDPLNFFQPFEHLPPGHENQLTRALLIVLRMSPLAHEYWLARLGSQRRLADLPEAQFNTQRRDIPIEEEPDEPLPLISVFLGPTSSFDEETVVAESDRRQVLDAIISYPGTLVVVVENKVAEADDWQAANINISGVAVAIAKDQRPVRVFWPDLLADFIGILEHKLVAGAEYDVLADFLVYVEDHFPGLGPYRTLRLSARNPFRVAMRARTLLSEALGTEASTDRWGTRCDVFDLPGMGSRAYLNPSEDMATISFSVYPADTLTQATEFYRRPESVEGVRRLARESGWCVAQNFHFGHMQAGYAWTSGDIDIGSYLDLWRAEIEHAGAIPREEWPEYFEWLVEKRIAQPDDRAEFDRCFTQTNRSTATPRPGLRVARQWAMHTAEELDATGRLAPQINAAYEKIVEALGA